MPHSSPSLTPFLPQPTPILLSMQLPPMPPQPPSQHYSRLVAYDVRPPSLAHGACVQPSLQMYPPLPVDQPTGYEPADAITTADGMQRRHPSDVSNDPQGPDARAFSKLDVFPAVDHPDLSSILPEGTYSQPEAAMTALMDTENPEKPMLSKGALEAAGILVVTASSAQFLVPPQNVDSTREQLRIFLTASLLGRESIQRTKAAIIAHDNYHEWNETVSRRNSSRGQR